MIDSAEIKRRALQLGFDLVGITTADPAPHVAEYRRWVADGFHGQMRYMTRRLDPAQILPGARSVIVVGMNYHNCGQPHVARFAGEVDYHDMVGERLRELAAMVDGVWYVDTGPVLERDFAQRAGLGWIGKHTNLINRHFGNWILLGEVITRVELAPDLPERERCGRCRRCLQACPTGALVAPYRLDARRCISYLTIELKGAIPEGMRPLIGERVFGCDACLEVCPWNRFARVSGFKPQRWPPLVDMLSWNGQQFAKFFRRTAVFRLGLAGLQRNICVVLGNRGEASSLPALERAMKFGDAVVREHALWAMKRILRLSHKRLL
ncbi:MAG: tRNA epoxyqueuosine(34) reductase QueG [Verrucomicrobiae bacterium]|nr:tRNA epoxyqueuosine(34) reductase QueG [Verrucomicrobiae bacterium]